LSVKGIENDGGVFAGVELLDVEAEPLSRVFRTELVDHLELVENLARVVHRNQWVPPLPARPNYRVV